MRRRAVASASAVALAAIGLVACSDSTQPEEPDRGTSTAPPEPHVPETSLPEQESVVVPDGDPAAQTAAVASELFESAPVVVTAPQGDPAAQLSAASAAVALGVPMLISSTGGATAPPEGSAETSPEGSEESSRDAAERAEPGDGEAVDGGAGDGLVDAVAQLGAETALAFGAAPDLDIDVVEAPADPAGLEELLGRAPEEAMVEPGQEAAAAAGLEPGTFRLLRGPEEPSAAAEGSAAPTESAPTEGSAEPTESPDASTAGAPTGSDDTAEPRAADGLPPTEPGGPLADLVVLSTGAPEQLAAVATARAAGADVVVVPDGDPRATSASVQALTAARPTHVLGLGGAFGDPETLSWRAATAATGVELPGGGQRVLPGKTYVALYGNPATPALGVLGEQGPEATVQRAREHAAPYEPLTGTTVVPALEIIATVASAGPGDDGNYSEERPVEELRPLVELAGEQGLYVVLDLQPGRTDFVTQAQHYEELLRMPHVGLALDPEWRLKPEEVHLRQIGQVDVAEVNEVVTWLADLVREHRLPQKLLVLHQFQVRMIPGVDGVDQSRSELEILVHADGQGSQPAKQGTWSTLHANAPSIRWWGWKNFYDEDSPMLTPEQTAQVRPFPNFISYQ